MPGQRLNTFQCNTKEDGTKEWYKNGILYREYISITDLTHADKEWYKNGLRHRENGPAVERVDGTASWYKNGELLGEDGALEDDNGIKRWYLYGKLHRYSGPAIEKANGTKEWYQNGKLHREDGPAVEWNSGYKMWYKNGLWHREDGPAIEDTYGDQEWYLNDELHREDGPAVINEDRYSQWWIHGKRKYITVNMIPFIVIRLIFIIYLIGLFTYHIYSTISGFKFVFDPPYNNFYIFPSYNTTVTNYTSTHLTGQQCIEFNQCYRNRPICTSNQYSCLYNIKCRHDVIGNRLLTANLLISGISGSVHSLIMFRSSLIFVCNSISKLDTRWYKQILSYFFIFLEIPRNISRIKKPLGLYTIYSYFIFIYFIIYDLIINLVIVGITMSLLMIKTCEFRTGLLLEKESLIIAFMNLIIAIIKFLLKIGKIIYKIYKNKRMSEESED